MVDKKREILEAKKDFVVREDFGKLFQLGSGSFSNWGREAFPIGVGKLVQLGLGSFSNWAWVASNMVQYTPTHLVILILFFIPPGGLVGVTLDQAWFVYCRKIQFCWVTIVE